LTVIARGTPGYSGAELANLLNEAALLAARTGKKAVSMPELERSPRQGPLGPRTPQHGDDRRGQEMDGLARGWPRVGQRHPQAHAPLAQGYHHSRGQALGATSICRRRHPQPQAQGMLDIIAVTMAGASPRRSFPTTSPAARRGDIQQATTMARAMVCQWGMSDKLGMSNTATPTSTSFSAVKWPRSKDYSEHTAQEIDDEVKHIIDDAFKRARRNHRRQPRQAGNNRQGVARTRTLEGSQVEEIIRTASSPPRLGAASQPADRGASCHTVAEVMKPSPPQIDPGLGSGCSAPA